jgi:hypothetical protein
MLRIPLPRKNDSTTGTLRHGGTEKQLAIGNGNYILAESSSQEENGDDDPSWWDEEACLMAFDLGIDDGGAGDTLLVSMQLGIIEQARKLKRCWKRELKDKNVKFFHSVDFDNISKGVFAGLSRTDRLELLDNLSGLIHRHLATGVTVRISKSFYDANTTNDFRSEWGTALGFAVTQLLACAHIYMDQLGHEKVVNILIEDGHKNSAQAVEMLRNFKPHASFPMKILSVGLGSKEDHPILQAADMLAYADWMQITKRDRTIWDAIHTDSGQYLTAQVDAGKELIEIGTMGIEKWKQQRKEFGEKIRREKEQRIREIRSGDGGAAQDSTQRNQEEIGAGEGVKGEKAPAEG